MIKSTYIKAKNQYKVTFELPQNGVGEKRDVRVLGSFNEWNWENGVKLKSGKNAYSGSTELSAGDHQFRYLVDGHQWVNDESAESFTDSGHGTTNARFTLQEVKEEKAPAKKPAAKKAAAKKAPAKKSGDAKIQAAKSAPASKPVVTPKKKTGKTDTKATAKKTVAKKAVAAKTKKDDLKKIEGIGPKVAGLLNQAGINTFADLGKASEKQLADVLQKAGARFRLAKHDTWQKQAKLAASGKNDELKKLQDELKGEKR